MVCRVQKLFNDWLRVQKEKHRLAVVLTFFPHPRMVLQKDTHIKLIDTLAEKEALLHGMGLTYW